MICSEGGYQAMDRNIPIPDGITGGCEALREIENVLVYIHTFGCTYNHGDTRKLVEVLINQGCRISDTPGGADVIIINSCTVVENTA